MIEFAQGFFNLEHPATTTVLPAGLHKLRGWLVEKPDAVITDLRVRCLGKVWPATYGFIRPDLAIHFKHPTPHLPAAFEIPIFLEPGRITLEFEALSISGDWIAVHSAIREVNGPAAPAFIREAEAPVNLPEFTEMLRYLLQSYGTDASANCKDLAAQLISSLGCPRYLLHPSPPFHAFFREPAIITRAAYGRILIDGYLFHEQIEVSKILATVDLHVWQTVAHGGMSPIAPQLFPQFPNAIRSNVKGYIDIPSHLPRPVTLRLYAELADGSRHLCAVQRFFPFGLEEEKRPLPPASPFLFYRAARSLHAELTNAGIVVQQGAAFRQALWQAWRDFSRRAPRIKTRAATFATDQPVSTTAPLGPVMVFTQNLDYEGAPLLLLENCRHLIAQGQASLTLVSARDGLLRKEFEQAGATVLVVDVSPLATANSTAAWRAALQVIATKINCHAARLIIANTLATYWAVHLAHLEKTPSLFYIHESTTPAAFFHGNASAVVVPFVERSFQLATRVSFNTTSTARYYEPFTNRTNFHLNPGWINLDAIDAHRAAHSRNSLRRDLGVIDGRILVVNLGAVCERKGQHVFAWAVDLFWRRRPDLAVQCDFWMVGGRNTAFDESMKLLVAGLDRPNLKIVPETPRAYDYLGAADLFVCSSYEESFPRVVLEAMAMEVPILSTDVHGIPFMVSHEMEAVLVSPGNSSTLADGMIRLISRKELAQTYARNARTRVETSFSTTLILPRQVELAHRTIAIHAAGG